MKLSQTPPKDGMSQTYFCGLTVSGCWATRLEEWEKFKKSDAGIYILNMENSCSENEEENNNLKQTMEVIRFLAFKHEVQYWNDANGTAEERLNSILFLARSSNWQVGGLNRNKEIKAKHSV